MLGRGPSEKAGEDVLDLWSCGLMTSVKESMCKGIVVA